MDRRAASLVLAALLALGCEKGEAPKAQRPPPVVGVVAVKAQEIPVVTSFVAQTESSQQVDIVARVSGFLDRIAYAEGQTVKAGQLLFQLDPKPFRAQLESARGQLMSQQARHSTAAANLKRIEPLVKQDALPQADLDRAQGEFDSSAAAVFSARARVTEAELNLGYASIHSPVNGVAGRALQRQGAYVNSMADSARLTYVAALDPAWVTFSVSQNQIAKHREAVEKGQVLPPKDNQYEVEVLMEADKPYPHRGRINFADPSFNQDTGAFMVRAQLPNPEHTLRPGMFVSVRLHGAVRPNAIAVPQLAVQQGSKGHLVYVVNASGVAELRPVVVGDYHGAKEIVILNGLQAGDRVVVEGVLKVVPGQPVKIEGK